ncbi:MAG TPA: AraC family transcriptional regulator [Methylomirabilota bacterium]|nr:AraC family transcriptional regulator [Methylomirabilota bacterium]
MTDHRVLVTEVRTGRVRPLLAGPPTVSSAAAGWDDFRLEEHPRPCWDLNQVCATDHLVLLHLEAGLQMQWQAQGASGSTEVAPGRLSILPACLPFSLTGRSPGRCILIALGPKFYSCVAATSGRPEQPAPVWTPELDDSLVRELVLALCHQAARPDSKGTIYAESLASALASHLMHRHATGANRQAIAARGLSRPQLRRTIQFIHDHLAEGASLQRLAEIAGLSPFHFARLFKQSTGAAPHEYLTRCRIERAKQLLICSPHSISDVATQVGFCDQSHLSRHFRRIVGLTPMAYLRHVAPVRKGP